MSKDLINVIEDLLEEKAPKGGHMTKKGYDYKSSGEKTYERR
jgi:hypothetical protein